MLYDNQLSGPIPPEVGQLTALTQMCVHDCAPRPARPSLRPRRALTSLLPVPVLCISRSPLTRSLRRSAQDVVRQPAQRSDPNRSWADDGAGATVRARLRPVARSPLPPPSPRAHPSLLPASVHFIPRSPLARSQRDAAQALNDNQLVGPIPTEVGLMTAVTHMCVHGCASARSPLPLPSPRAHLAPPRLRALHPTLSDDALPPRPCAGAWTPTCSTARSQPKLVC